MWKDPIVEEVRKMRDQISKKHGYSIKKLFSKVVKKTTQKCSAKKSTKA